MAKQGQAKPSKAKQFKATALTLNINWTYFLTALIMVVIMVILLIIVVIIRSHFGLLPIIVVIIRSYFGLKHETTASLIMAPER